MFTAIDHFPFLETLANRELSPRMSEWEPSSRKDRRRDKQIRQVSSLRKNGY